MCGICGILNLSRDRLPAEDLQAMTSVLGHRGPDDQGKLVSGPVALGFRRLSILDLSRGHQPMCNEERNVWIAFNGEIYNDAELRPGLFIDFGVKRDPNVDRKSTRLNYSHGRFSYTVLRLQ